MSHSGLPRRSFSGGGGSGVAPRRPERGSSGSRAEARAAEPRARGLGGSGARELLLGARELAIDSGVYFGASDFSGSDLVSCTVSSTSVESFGLEPQGHSRPLASNRIPVPWGALQTLGVRSCFLHRSSVEFHLRMENSGRAVRRTPNRAPSHEPRESVPRGTLTRRA